MTDVPYSATELARIAREGSDQDVLDALEAMTARHGPGITVLMLYSASETLERERLATEALEQVRAFLDNLPAEGDAISGYTRGGVGYELTSKALQSLLDERQQLRELLGSIWLYINWRYVTKQLTTEQKDLFAREVDAHVMAGQVADGEEPRPVADRWWRD